jgi:membrane protease YdiL (CAAX protease family)
LAVVVDSAFLAFAMLVILPFLRSSFPVESYTSGWVKATLIFSVVRFGLVAVGVAMIVGHLRARDVGLRWEKLPGGALVVFGTWLVMQLIGVLLGLFTTGKVALSPIWTPDRVPYIAGELIAQFLGNAFAEEIIFRGFLLTQLYLILKTSISGRRRLLMVSVLISQLIFSLSHIPQRIFGDYSLPGLLLSLVIVWVSGVVFALLYLRTENIFVAIGMHALVNVPVGIVALPSQAVGELLPLFLTLVLIVVWGPLTRWKERLGAAQPAQPPTV